MTISLENMSPECGQKNTLDFSDVSINLSQQQMAFAMILSAVANQNLHKIIINYRKSLGNPEEVPFIDPEYTRDEVWYTDCTFESITLSPM